MDRTILDFGCGEGHLAYVLSNLFSAKRVVGYHEEQSAKPEFGSSAPLLFTDSWNMASGLGPYDIIVANDVIDHGASDRQLEMIKQAKSQTGKVFIRCHPWCSRHGAHLHDGLNRAYLHLVFDDDELYGMGLQPRYCHKLINPIASYRNLFKEHGLTVLREEIVTKDVELFFTQNSRILRRIKERWANSPEEQYRSGLEFPHEHMSIEFVNYTLV